MHQIDLNESPRRFGQIGRLTIAARNSPYGEIRRGRVSRVAGGLRLRSENTSGVRVTGEDLFALREMLAEIPEEEFVRPKDPVARWNDFDVVKGCLGTIHIRVDGSWVATGGRFGASVGGHWTDHRIDLMVDHPDPALRGKILVQKSGVDEIADET